MSCRLCYVRRRVVRRMLFIVALFLLFGFCQRGYAWELHGRGMEYSSTPFERPLAG